MNETPPVARVLALAVSLGVILPLITMGGIGVAAAGNHPTDSVGNQPLSIGVQQGAGTVTISVSHNGVPFNNATVTVTSDAPYAGNDTYENGTDETGILTLPTPNQTVNTTITAEKDGLDGNITVTLHANNGTGPSFLPPGMRIAAFVHGLHQHGNIVIGPAVSNYALSNHALDGSPSAMGPPSHAGPPPHAGPPSHANPNNDNNDARAPPDHAGGPPGKAATGSNENISEGHGPRGNPGTGPKR